MTETDWPVPAQLFEQDESEEASPVTPDEREEAELRGFHWLTPRESEGSDKRLKIRVSQADYDKIGRGAMWKGREVDVADLGSGEVYRIRGAACNLPTCFCDAVVVPKRFDS